MPCEAVLCLAVLWPQVGHAQAEPNDVADTARRVVLLTGFSDNPAVLAQLRIELLAMGFTVVVSERNAATTDISQQMRTRAADVAVVGRVDGHVEVLVEGADSLVVTPPDDATSRIVSMRIAEQIRASLVLRGTAPPQEPAEEVRESERNERPPAEPREPVLLADLALGYEMGPGGLGGLTRGALRARYFPTRHFGVVGFALAPVQPLTVTDEQSRADVWAWHFGAGLEFRKRWGDQVELSIAAGGGGSTVRVSGSATAPDEGATEVVHPALLFGSVGGSWQTQGPLYFGGRATALYSIPALRVHFVDTVVAKRDFFIVPEAFLGVAFF